MPLRFTLRQLEYLIAVGDAGTIAAAAARTNVSSPSISAAISQLEAELGIQLFVRNHAQGLTLTPGGARVVAEARRIVDQAAALTDLATEIARRPRGPIAIGALTTIAPLISARLRRSFEEAYPDATVTLRSGDQVELLHMLGRAEIDVALTYDLDVPSDVRFEPVIALPPHVMLPADHPMAEEDRVSLKALEREPLILLDMPLSREYFLATLHAAGVTPKVAERVRDMAVVRSLVANGFGYGLLNTGTRTMRAPDGAGLAIRPIREDLAPLALGLATKQTQQRSAIVAALFAHVHATIGRQGLPETGMPPARGTP